MIFHLTVQLLIVTLLLYPSRIEAQVCIGQLGISAGGIGDEQLTASSFRSSLTVPTFGRLNDVKGHGGWCASTSFDQYIEVDLLTPTYVSGISTQGRYFYIGREEYTLDYTVDYANVSQNWQRYQSGQRIIANINAENIVSRQLSSPILARYFRIYPQRFFGGSPCLRFELLGCYYDPPCEGNLGMVDGRIRNSQLSAVGIAIQGAGVRYSRLYGPSAWCLVANSMNPGADHLQIDLLKPTRFTAITTQGQSNSYVRDYAVRYCPTADLNTCVFYSSGQGQLIQGNTNGDTPNTHVFTAPIVARLIQIYPIDFNQAPCMRVELHGCSIGDGIASYNVTLGGLPSPPTYLDSTYNGTITSLGGGKTEYTGGRGKLTDGIHGSADTRTNNGNNWIGWHKTTYPQPQLVIELDSILTLYVLKLYVSHYPAQDTSVFEEAYVSFSENGNDFGTELKYMPVIGFNTTTTRAGYVTLGIVGKKGDAIRCRFKYGSQNLLLISEIEVQTLTENQATTAPSTMATTAFNITTATSTSSTTSSSATTEMISTTQPETTNGTILTPTNAGATTETLVTSAPTTASKIPSTNPTTRVTTVRPTTGTTEATTIPTTPETTATTAKATSAKATSAKATSAKATTRAITATNSTISRTFASIDRAPSTGVTTGDIILYVLAGLFFIATLILLICVCQARRRRNRVYYVPHTSALELTKQKTNSTIRKKVAPGDKRNTVKRGSSQRFNKDTDLLIVHQGSERNEIYFENVQGICGNSLYQVNTIRQFLFYHRAEEQEFQDSQFSDKQLIGNGTFGQIYTAVLLQEQGDSVKKQLVCIKKIKTDIDNFVDDDINKEKDILSRLRHNHIAQFYGVIADESQITTVIEYCEYGDLHQFLVAHSPLSMSGRQSICESLHTGTLIEIASQIALGMEYLSKLGIIHRDLAVRNCLVCDRYHIKISNIAMSRAIHANAYCSFESRANLPVRWMAPETIALGGYTKHSDIWSYGVTLWELFTYADFPYENMTDQKVIANAYRILKGNKSKKLLSKPLHATDEVYNMMQKCWTTIPESRINFTEIAIQLSKK